MHVSAPSVHKPAATHAKPGRAWAILKFSSLGLEMAVAVSIGLLLGYWLDLELDTSPALLLVCLGFGIAAGFLGVFRAAREAEAMMEAELADAAAAPGGREGAERDRRETDQPVVESKQ